MAQYNDRGVLLQSVSHLAVDKARTNEVSRTVTKSQEILLKADSVFPLMLIPDTISIDRTNITITHRHFYKLATIIIVKISDILNVTPNIGPFFGSLRITTTFVDPKSPYVVNYLKRDDALKINRFLQGYKIAAERQIDTTHLDKDELVGMLDKLSHDGTEAG